MSRVESRLKSGIRNRFFCVREICTSCGKLENSANDMVLHGRAWDGWEKINLEEESINMSNTAWISIRIKSVV